MSKLKENFCSLDLEMNQPSGKIIQVGAVVGNIRTGEILGKLNAIVDPQEFITDKIVKLCGITDEMIAEEGTDLSTAYFKLVDFCEKFDCSKMVIQWGCGDVDELKAECEEVGMHFNMGFGDKISNDTINFIFGRRCFDVKQFAQARRIQEGKSMQGGLARALVRAGLVFQGRKHWAPDDAYNTFVLFRKYLWEA